MISAKQRKTGFTFIETLVVCAILVLLFLISIPAIYNFSHKSALDRQAGKLVEYLTLAKNRSVSSEGPDQWGVYFNLVFPQSFIFFKGESYVLRDAAFDQEHFLEKGVIFEAVNLAGAVQEAVFERINGQTSQYGQVSFQSAGNPAEKRIVYIEPSGRVDLSYSLAVDDNRVKDCRHVHFVYSRFIDTTTEKIILTFEGGAVQEIEILNNMSAGQIFWQGEVDAAGEEQQITIHTHRLNNPDTLFCLHRDLRYNSKALKVDIDGDPNYPALSPVLIEYFSDNSTSKGTSAFVEEPIWQ